MKIIYIANARIPTEKAHGIQIMKMCEAFALNNDVELILPMRFNPIKDGPFFYYGVEKKFRIKKMPCFDLIRFHRYLGNFGLWLETVTFFFFLFFYLVFKKADIFYTRDRLLLPLAIIKKNFVFEAHTFPRNYFLYAVFLKKLKGIVTITQKLKESFMERGFKQDNIFTAPDGVDLVKFDIKETKDECRKLLCLPNDKKIVLYTGHFYKWKGVEILIEASKLLPEDAKVYLVGGVAEDREKYEKLIQGIKQKIQMIGHRPHQEMPYWLKAADALVLPNSGKEDISKYWTSPMKLFEYMASGRPIVASGLPSIKEILNADNAVLVRPDDSEDLARGIIEVLQNQSLSDKISEKALIDARQYSWAKRAQKIINFINNYGNN
ncbi:MAG: glycosyltransferase family 4 protein [Candidatus Nealsonbacteria bacterium]